MYNIMIFDDLTMNFSLVYMSDNLKAIVNMYSYYQKKYREDYIIVTQTIQSNEGLLKL